MTSFQVLVLCGLVDHLRGIVLRHPLANRARQARQALHFAQEVSLAARTIAQLSQLYRFIVLVSSRYVRYGWCSLAPTDPQCVPGFNGVSIRWFQTLDAATPATHR